jgi:hypothetical protein
MHIGQKASLMGFFPQLGGDGRPSEIVSASTLAFALGAWMAGMPSSLLLQLAALMAVTDADDC